jgi:hypothetical protein
MAAKRRLPGWQILPSGLVTLGLLDFSFTTRGVTAYTVAPGAMAIDLLLT